MTTIEFRAARWRKSSHSGGSGSECVEVAALWRKSSHSSGSEGQCVEVAALPSGPMIGLRDSKDPGGPVLSFTPAVWALFITDVKHGTSRR